MLKFFSFEVEIFILFHCMLDICKFRVFLLQGLIGDLDFRFLNSVGIFKLLGHLKIRMNLSYFVLHIGHEPMGMRGWKAIS